MYRFFVLSTFLVSLLLSACRSANATEIVVTPTLVVSATPDPCSSENLPSETAKINRLMREFDDYSSLASNTPQSQLVVLIPQMQRVLRDAEDQKIPACLVELKKLQLAHMNVVVQTLIAFMNSTDVSTVNKGIAESRELHAFYDVELARLLGFTQAAPAPSATLDPNSAAVTSTPSAIVTNPGPANASIRSAPDTAAPEMGILEVNSSTLALGKSTNEQWVLVDVPNQPGLRGWVDPTFLVLSIPIAQLPVVNP